MLGKIGLGVGHSKPTEPYTERVDLDTKNPNKNTDTGKPPIAFAPGAWTARPLQPHPQAPAASFRAWRLEDIDL